MNLYYIFRPTLAEISRQNIHLISDIDGHLVMFDSQIKQESNCSIFDQRFFQMHFVERGSNLFAKGKRYQQSQEKSLEEDKISLILSPF